VIEHGVNGFLVKQDHEWLSYMSLLASDDGLRAKMGEAARAMAARYVIEDGWKLWESAYGAMFGTMGPSSRRSG
jgi:glycosyltransferase involved in cell wall biosynthesis